MTRFPEDSSAGRACYLAALIAPRLRFDPSGNDVAADDYRRRAVFAARAVIELQKIAKAEKRAAEYACNFPMTDREASRADMAQEKRLQRAEALLEPFGLTVRLGGDPRGCCCTIVDPKNPVAGDGWGDGWGVW